MNLGRNTNSLARYKGAKIIFVLLLSCYLPLTTSFASSGLYRWVDSNGVVHYGDHVPAEYSKRERQVLNRQAIVINTLEAQKTKEQIQLEAQERARQADLRRLAAEKAHRDRILLSTYSSPQEIDLALSNGLTEIDNQINLVNINIKNLNKQRSTILDRIAYFGENESEADENTITQLENQLNTTNDELANVISIKTKLNQEINDLTVKYNNDKTQFVKLKIQRDEATMAENHPLL